MGRQKEFWRLGEELSGLHTLFRMHLSWQGLYLWFCPFVLIKLLTIKPWVYLQTVLQDRNRDRTIFHRPNPFFLPRPSLLERRSTWVPTQTVAVTYFVFRTPFQSCTPSVHSSSLSLKSFSMSSSFPTSYSFSSSSSSVSVPFATFFSSSAGACGLPAGTLRSEVGAAIWQWAELVRKWF